MIMGARLRMGVTFKPHKNPLGSSRCELLFKAQSQHDIRGREISHNFALALNQSLRRQLTWEIEPEGIGVPLLE